MLQCIFAIPISIQSKIEKVIDIGGVKIEKRTGRAQAENRLMLKIV